jgi:hypothetical protein
MDEHTRRIDPPFFGEGIPAEGGTLIVQMEVIVSGTGPMGEFTP